MLHFLLIGAELFTVFEWPLLAVISTDRRNTIILRLKNEVFIMKYRTRIYYSEEQKSLMWDRWEKGESLHSIARLFDRGHGSIAGIISTTGY